MSELLLFDTNSGGAPSRFDAMSLLERPRLLTLLASSRHRPRVVCAPAAFGKSVLAFQYARIANSFTRTTWIDAGNPLFFRLLMDANDPSIGFDLPVARSLVVVDGLVELSREDACRFADFVGMCCARGADVLVTTRWEGCAEALDNPLLVDGTALLVSEEDISSAPSAVAARISPMAPSERVAGCCLGLRDGREPLLADLCGRSANSASELLAVLMLLLQKGELRELQPFFKKPLISLLDERGPSSLGGFSRATERFRAFSLTEDERMALASHHRAGLRRLAVNTPIVASPVGFASFFVKRGDCGFAARLAASWADVTQRREFVKAHGRDLLFEGYPALLLGLVSQLPKKAAADVLALEFQANLLVGDHDAAKQGLRELVDMPGDGRVGLLKAWAAAVGLAWGCLPAAESARRIRDGLSAWDSLRAAAPKGISVDSPTQRQQERVADLALVFLADRNAALSRLAEALKPSLSARDSLELACLFALLCANGSLAPTHEASRAMLRAFEPVFQRLLMQSMTQCRANVLEQIVDSVARCVLGRSLECQAQGVPRRRVEELEVRLAGQRVEGPCARGVRTQVVPLAVAPVEDPFELIPLRLFGGFDLVAKGNEAGLVRLRDKAKMFLGVLALNQGKEVSREWLEGVMWPGFSEQYRHQSFYSLWSYLNKEMENAGRPGALMRTRRTVALRADALLTDVSVLRGLCDKLTHPFSLRDGAVLLEQFRDVYRGPLLPGFDSSEVVAQRKSWATRAVGALMSAAEQFIASDELRLASEYLGFASTVDPLREDVCYLRADTLRRLGQHMVAMELLYERQQGSKSDYGVEGSRRLGELYERILSEMSWNACSNPA